MAVGGCPRLHSSSEVPLRPEDVKVVFLPRLGAAHDVEGRCDSLWWPGEEHCFRARLGPPRPDHLRRGRLSGAADRSLVDRRCVADPSGCPDAAFDDLFSPQGRGGCWNRRRIHDLTQICQRFDPIAIPCWDAQVWDARISYALPGGNANAVYPANQQVVDGGRSGSSGGKAASALAAEEEPKTDDDGADEAAAGGGAAAGRGAAAGKGGRGKGARGAGGKGAGGTGAGPKPALSDFEKTMRKKSVALCTDVKKQKLILGDAMVACLCQKRILYTACLAGLRRFRLCKY